MTETLLNKYTHKLLERLLEIHCCTILFNGTLHKKKHQLKKATWACVLRTEIVQVGPLIRGFAKLKNSKNQKHLDRAHPTVQTFFLETHH